MVDFGSKESKRSNRKRGEQVNIEDKTRESSGEERLCWTEKVSVTKNKKQRSKVTEDEKDDVEKMQPENPLSEMRMMLGVFNKTTRH